jgi:NADH:ubiquinone reductase (H+-translocating)
MESTSQGTHPVIIVGGGFGGIRCALDLAAQKPRGMRIQLISNRPTLEYYGAIYKLIAGTAPSEVAVPLSLLLRGKGVELIQDTVTGADLNAKALKGSSGATYPYSSVVLAVGAETAYFGIPGMQEHSLTFKSVQDALELKRHLHATVSAIPSLPKEEQAIAAHFVVVGGGATGVEVASELMTQGRILAKQYTVDPSLISVDLIEALPRVMALLPEDMSPKILAQLRKIGVNVYLDRGVLKAEKDQVFLQDLTIRTKTIVWTAGVKASALYASIQGLETDKRGRVVVDEHLKAKGQADVYVIGDGASTQYSGMAQTAIADGSFVAGVIARTAKGKPSPAYVPQKPSLALPVGDYWAAVLYKGMRFYGFVGWFLRQAADIRAFLTLMSPWTLLKVLRGKTGTR